jgi:hypothetical protein
MLPKIYSHRIRGKILRKHSEMSATLLIHTYIGLLDNSESDFQEGTEEDDQQHH